MKHHQSGFTLIELLIVIAIIAILALIAIPNFLEAQTRSKVSRAQADMRSVAIALEAYFVDNNEYPLLAGYKVCVDAGASRSAEDQYDRGGILLAWQLSTPIAYITSTRISDPFCNVFSWNDLGEISGGTGGDQSFTLSYVNIELYRKRHSEPIPTCKWGLLSLGPDYQKGAGGGWAWKDYSRFANDAGLQMKFRYLAYDPSNGTVSGGDIMRWQIQ